MAVPQPPPEPEDETATCAVFDLARGGDTQGLIEVVAAGVPVDLTTATGDTLLLLAAYHDHPAAVQALLSRGADPARVNDRGQTPLAAAVFRRSAEIVTSLVRAGADPDHGSPSARETAAFFQLPEMTALLPGDPAPAAG